jgi:hypothetical protein
MNRKTRKFEFTSTDVSDHEKQHRELGERRIQLLGFTNEEKNRHNKPGTRTPRAYPSCSDL